MIAEWADQGETKAVEYKSGYLAVQNGSRWVDSPQSSLGLWKNEIVLKECSLYDTYQLSRFKIK